MEVVEGVDVVIELGAVVEVVLVYADGGKFVGIPDGILAMYRLLCGVLIDTKQVLWRPIITRYTKYIHLFSTL